MTKNSSRTLNIFLLSMINVAAICSIKNWPLTAVYGFSSLFYFFPMIPFSPSTTFISKFFNLSDELESITWFGE